MKLQDARTISASELYDRRKQAILLYKKGNMTQIEIGEVVGVGRNVICEWIKKMEAWRPKGFKTCLLGSPGRDRSDFKRVSRT
jgi:transposase